MRVARGRGGALVCMGVGALLAGADGCWSVVKRGGEMREVRSGPRMRIRTSRGPFCCTSVVGTGSVHVIGRVRYASSPLGERGRADGGPG